MLAKCANPECSVVFRYVGAGKLFRMPSQHCNAGATGCKNGHAPETMQHFWLCSDCARTMTVAVERSGRVVVMRRAFIRPYREAFGTIRPVPVIGPTQLPAIV
ncbi:MAG TPA: hypothetical protein VD837_18150 [Terriglobales bacterium]|nr:hypothetical protein [Terriglobales bacterium]